MAKRTVVECEICWNEVLPESLSILALKQDKKTQQFEICSDCLVKLKQQLVSQSKLSKDWSFSNKTIVAVQPKMNSVSVKGIEATAHNSEVGDEPTEEDDILERHKNRELILKEGQKIEGDREQQSILSGGPSTIEPEGPCKHYNKTPETVGTVEGVKMFFQRCRDCNAILKPRQKRR